MRLFLIDDIVSIKDNINIKKAIIMREKALKKNIM